MLISNELNTAINEEIGRELEASHLYANMAAYVDLLALKQLVALLLKQSDEEREHAMKFVRYVMDTGGKVEIPAVPAPQANFKSVEEVLETALQWEKDITNHINNLYSLAVRLNDYAAQDFLRWFVTEQIEEVSKAEDLLMVARQAGARHLYMIEAYLAHIG